MSGPDAVLPPPTRRFLGALVGIGLLWRLVLDGRTPMPREDGVNYLWMAERFAAGEGCLAVGEIFSPLLGLVIAIPVALGIDPFAAGQLALAVVGAFAVVPIARIGEQVQPGTGRLAGCLFFLASRPVLLGAQIYTEPLFLLVAGYGFLFGLQKRFLRCGLLCGLAFLVRPEAAVIPFVFLLGSRRAWPALLPLAASVLALALWRGLCGHGFDPVPKLAFIRAHNVAAGIGWFARLSQVPGCLIEAFGLVAVFAVIGGWRRRPAPLLWLLGIALLIICSYVPRWRFFVNWSFVVVPLAACGVAALRGRRWWIGGWVAVELVLAWTGGSDANRIVERQVGELLRRELRPGERIATDLTRVRYFAGFRPLEPRHHSPEELIEAGGQARFLVLRSRRRMPGKDGALVVDLVRGGLPGCAEFPLPEALAPAARQRGLVVLVRN